MIMRETIIFLRCLFLIESLITIFPLRQEEGTVAQLMRHELGLPLFSRSLHPRDFTRENIRKGLSVKDV